MANDYLDYFTINGTEVYLQDYGREQPNGVPVLDPQGKLPMKYLTPLFASNVRVSPEDPNNDSLVDWAVKLSSPGLKDSGKSWKQGTGANTASKMQYLVYANGLWVCGSDGQGCWWSSADGKSWKQGTEVNTGYTMPYTMQYLVYANGLWVCGSIAHGM